MTETKPKRIPPFSLRLSEKERARLRKMAGDIPLGAFIRSKIFDGSSNSDKARQRKQIAQILGLLGKSELSKNLSQLAYEAQSGSLVLTPDTEKTLNVSLQYVEEMREMLLLELHVGNRRRK